MMSLPDRTKLFATKIPVGSINLNGVWNSIFEPNSDKYDKWHPERMVIETDGHGAFTCESEVATHQTFDWVAEGTIYKDAVIAGRWASKKEHRPKAAGAFILHIALNGDELLGFLLGNSEPGGKANYGAWLLTKEQGGGEPSKRESIERTKQYLADLCPGLLDLVLLDTQRASKKLQDLAKNPELKLNALQLHLHDEALRCFASGAYRSAAVMGWNFAFDCIRRWVWDDPDRQRRFKEKLGSSATTYAQLCGERESAVLDAMEKAKLIDSFRKKRLTRFLEERNSYAHAEECVPSRMQVQHYLEDVVDLLTAHFKS